MNHIVSHHNTLFSGPKGQQYCYEDKKLLKTWKGFNESPAFLVSHLLQLPFQRSTQRHLFSAARQARVNRIRCYPTDVISELTSA